jgi:hypothetical protein
VKSECEPHSQSPNIIAVLARVAVHVGEWREGTGYNQRIAGGLRYTVMRAR